MAKMKMINKNEKKLENIVATPKVEILEELKNKRKEKEKHFRQKDGSVIANFYPEAVNYFNESEQRYRQIDNELIDTEDQQNYKTKYNYFDVYVPKRVKKEFYRIQKDNTSIQFLFLDNKDFLV